MIPLHKLRRLPRHQRLRKIANLLDREDARLAAFHGAKDLRADAASAYFSEIALLLCEDEEFPPEAKRAIIEISAELAATYAYSRLPDRRPINALRHIVNGAAGKQTADWDLVDGRGGLAIAARRVFPGVRLFLDDVRSPFNVGSIFRAAESFGVERVYISALCASPDHPRAARSSMGCTETVPWERAELETLEGPMFALETQGCYLDDFVFPGSGILIVGSEELGVSPYALALAEKSLGRLTIPTIGAKGSLNVAVAFGIAMQEWCARLTASVDSQY